MAPLHPVQQRLIAILKENVGESLTVRELQEELKVSSPSVVQHHILQLEKKGYLRRNPSNPRDYQVLADSPEKNVTFLNLYGLAQCGPNGSILDGDPIERIPIASKLLGFPSAEAFMVRAKGKSMLPKIHPNDLIIAKKSPSANNGDIVVCVNQGMAIIKKLQMIKQANGTTTFNLLSLNQDVPSFHASEDFHIEGIVKSILSYSV
ncbi:HTH domain-containing protein [Candidatus Daviesbacteria bacterium]|nr:HTH domain-containing protein [Candidatus Daviesbacteria bacterium]